MIRLSDEVYNEYMYFFDWFQNRYAHTYIDRMDENERGMLGIKKPLTTYTNKVLPTENTQSTETTRHTKKIV